MADWLTLKGLKDSRCDSAFSSESGVETEMPR